MLRNIRHNKLASAFSCRPVVFLFLFLFKSNNVLCRAISCARNTNDETTHIPVELFQKQRNLQTFVIFFKAKLFSNCDVIAPKCTRLLTHARMRALTHSLTHIQNTNKWMIKMLCTIWKQWKAHKRHNFTSNRSICKWETFCYKNNNTNKMTVKKTKALVNIFAAS